MLKNRNKALLLVTSIVAIAACLFYFYGISYFGKSTYKPGQEVLYMHETWIRSNVVFHGSQNRDLDALSPRSIGVRDKTEGDVIFATPHMEYASTFMTDIKWNDRMCKKGSFDNGPVFFIGINKEKFLQDDKGGAIYLLPSDSFYFDLGLSDDLTKKEWLSKSKYVGYGSLRDWVSRRPVKPLYKFEFKSTLSAMIALGVQVYFVDDEQWKQIELTIKNPNRSLYRKLLMTLVSENKKLGKNVIPLFDYSKY